MKRKLIGLLLIVHGLIQIMFEFLISDANGEVGWDGTSWLLTGVLDNGTVLILGQVLWGVAIAGFVIAGLAVLSSQKSWRSIDVIASIASLSAFILFWFGLKPEPIYWVLGPVIAVVNIIALAVLRWPSDEMLFGIKNKK